MVGRSRWGRGWYLAVIAEFHVLCKIETLDGGDVADVEEPDVSQDFAFEDEAGDDAAEDVDVDFQVRCRVYDGQLRR